MDRKEIIGMMKNILEKQGKSPAQINEDVNLRDISFRSLDFSELCLRVEQVSKRELNFEATTLRAVNTVRDVCNFIEQAFKS